MARNFVGASSELIDCSLGGGGSLSGAASFGVILKRNADSGGTARTLFAVGTTNASLRGLLFTAVNQVNYRGNNTSNGSATITCTTADGWVCLVGTKAAGASTPRLHKYVYSTNVWTHANAGATQADSTPTGGVQLGHGVGSFSTFDGAVFGSWAAALTDAQVESLAFSLPAWFQVSPNGLWLLDQAATATLVVDATGNGANQSGITGTSISTSNVPVFSYGHPIVVVPLPGGALAQITDTETGTGTDAGEAIAAATTDPDTGTGADAGEALAAALTDPETATGADAGESLAAAAAGAETASGADAGESLAVAASDTETGTAVDTEAVTISFTDPDTGTVAETEAIAAALTDAESGSGADAGEAISVAVSDSDSGTAVEAELMGVTLTDDDLAVIAEAEAIVAAVLDADDGTGDEAGTVVEHAVGDPGCMTLTISDHGEMTLTLSTLGDATVSIADDPHTLTLTISDAHMLTLALATLATLTLTIEECDDAITPDTGEARVTVTGEERITTGDETRVIA